MVTRTILAFVWFLVAALGAIGQTNPAEEKPTIEKVRALRLPYAAGSVPAYYSAGFEARALRYQKAIIACQQWYDQQVGKHADFTLAVLSKVDWEKATSVPYPMPHAVGVYRSPPPGVVLPARFEDFPNSADFTSHPELLVENISYHELGHIYASLVGIKTDDNLLAETYANIFTASFIRAKRPDMLFFLQGPPAKLPPQRYTSLEDVEYLSDDVGFTNYGWFQFQINRLADLLLKDKPLPRLLAELKNFFHDSTQRPFGYVAAQLETIRPGIAKEMGALWNPTTIPEAKTKPCSGVPTAGRDSNIVVLNLSPKPIRVTSGKNAPVTIASDSWYTFGAHSGTLVQIDSGVCFVFGDEPSIARITAK